jgi:hypothetical protein
MAEITILNFGSTILSILFTKKWTSLKLLVKCYCDVRETIRVVPFFSIEVLSGKRYLIQMQFLGPG